MVLISLIPLRSFLAFSRFFRGQFLNFCPVCIQTWIVPSRFGVLQHMMAFQVKTLADNSIRLGYWRKAVSSSSKDEMKKKPQWLNNKFFGVFTFENHNATLLRDGDPSIHRCIDVLLRNGRLSYISAKTSNLAKKIVTSYSHITFHIL
jgi:hypothetical protein